ncbi:MAG: LPS-assembly protein LptD [Deltaproteobacteria bacterium]|nr:LPS-assembly protein LptD [Deltaproteobacteria bacterium]
MRGLVCLCILTAFLMAAPPFAASVEPSGDIFKKDLPIDLTADFITYDKAADTYTARGSVVILQDKMTLTANEARLNVTTGMADAAGNVEVFDVAGSTLKADSLTMNINEKTSVAVHARIFYKKDNIHLRGKVIKKTGPEDYTSDGLTYTTCDCADDETPAWDFEASGATVTIGEYMTAWNARFHIMGVPVLYSPYVSLPMKRERQSGFLQPKPGYSKLRGFVLKNSFFWAMTDNMDSTYYLDVETRRGLGKGVEYRYIRNRKSNGEASFYHYKEKNIDRVREFRKGANNLSRPKTAADNRWAFKLKHLEDLGPGTTIKADINAVSDDEYFLDFGRGQERTLESLESNVALSKNWSSYSLSAQFRHFNNFLSAYDRDTLQMLPVMSLKNSNQRVAGGPFYLSGDYNYAHFSRAEGMDGDRLDAHPRLSLPLSPGGWFDFTPSFAPRATWYLVKHDPHGRYAERYLYDVTVDMTTTFVKIYRPEFESVKAIRHTFRPKLVYTYIPEAVQDDTPKFDSIDFVAAANNLTYSLNSILTGKVSDADKSKYPDYVYMDLNQTYNINEGTRNLNGPQDKRRPFSNVNGEIRIKPAAWSAVTGSPRGEATGRGSYDVYNKWFASYDASLSALHSVGDLTASHRFTRGSASYIEGAARAHAAKTVDLTYTKRFSITNHKSLETVYGMEHKQQCWSYQLSYTERPEEKVVYLTFNLLGLGRVAGVQGRIDGVAQ